MPNKDNKIIAIFFFWALLLFSPNFLFSPIPGNATKIENLKNIEDKLWIYINKDREKNGLDPIYMHDGLNGIAEKHNEKMAQAGQLSHVFPGYDSLGKRLANANISTIRCGENLAQSDIPLASMIHDQFMQSPEHQSNILNPHFTHCGIKICSEKKLFYVTETFVQFALPGSGAEAEFLLKEHLELWFVKQFNYRFVYHLQSIGYARQLSEKPFSGKSLIELKSQWGNFYCLRLGNPDLESIKKILKEEIEKISLEAISLGVTITNTEKSPSRNYSVAALCFGKYFAELHPDELRLIFFNTLNQWRAKSNQPVLKLNQGLNIRAQQAIKSFPEKHQEVASGYFISAFLLTNPHQLSPDIQKNLENWENPTGEIGIAIQIPKGDHSFAHPFRVCVAIQK